MPASKAQQKAVSKYMKENYDVYQIRMPKGKKAAIKAHADAHSESVNSFINRAIDQAMAQEAVESPTRHVDALGVSLPYEADKCAPAASDGRTEVIHREDDA